MEEQLDLLCIVSKGGEMGNWSKLQESDFFFSCSSRNGENGQIWNRI